MAYNLINVLYVHIYYLNVIIIQLYLIGFLHSTAQVCQYIYIDTDIGPL